MKVRLNGQEILIDSPCTVSELLERQHLAQRRVAVEVNGEIIPRSVHINTALNEEDRIEIVHALGGG